MASRAISSTLTPILAVIFVFGLIVASALQSEQENLGALLPHTIQRSFPRV